MLSTTPLRSREDLCDFALSNKLSYETPQPGFAYEQREKAASIKQGGLRVCLF